MRRNGSTAVDWGNFCRDVCKKSNDRDLSAIGGVDNSGIPIIVDIDELLLFHRKYNRGQLCPNHCVFGGIERESHKCFLVEVPDCTAATLEALILRYIRHNE